jgi:hypothetical protein
LHASLNSCTLKCFHSGYSIPFDFTSNSNPKHLPTFVNQCVYTVNLAVSVASASQSNETKLASNLKAGGNDPLKCKWDYYIRLVTLPSARVCEICRNPPPPPPNITVANLRWGEHQ